MRATTRSVYVYISGCDDHQYLLIEGVPVGALETFARIQKAAEVRAGGCVPSFQFAATLGEAKEKLLLDDYEDLLKLTTEGALLVRSTDWLESDGDIVWTKVETEDEDE